MFHYVHQLFLNVSGCCFLKTAGGNLVGERGKTEPNSNSVDYKTKTLSVKC